MTITTDSINPARVDFVTLRLFCAVVSAGSITKGAESCHLALSAASRRLSDFEAATGTALLERTAQGIVLTSAGHVAMQHAMKLFQGFEQFSSEIREHARGSRGHVRLWANMSALTDFLPTGLASFMKAVPEIRVEVEEQLSGDIVRALLDGLADVGVFAEGTPTFGLEIKPFCTDELIVACACDHPLAERTSVTFRTCLEYEFVGLNRGASLLELITRQAEHEALPLRLRVQVRSYGAMCKMIAANLGLGILPRAAIDLMRDPTKIKVLTLDEVWAERTLVVATSANRPPTPATMRLLAYLHNTSEA
jgi:DNA-binding transcriptional LysR family regulator